jgi:RimJ/RimL family protein N-acetyltransferase
MNDAKRPPVGPSFTRRTVLKPVADGDLDLLRDAEIAWENSFRWRHHGAHPSPAQFRAEFWSGVLCAFLVIRRRDRVAVGCVVIYNADLHNQRAFCGCYQFSSVTEPALAIEGMLAVLRYTFANWSFRKIYFEIPGFNVDQMRHSLRKYLRHEATFNDYWYFGERFWDHFIFALGREDFRYYEQTSFGRWFA